MQKNYDENIPKGWKLRIIFYQFSDIQAFFVGTQDKIFQKAGK